ncbi:MAG: DsbA family protein [Bacteroidota bacterium]
MNTLHIEFIGDFICPWCYIGHQRLLGIKEDLAGKIHLEIDPQPYFLYPDIPAEGRDKSSFRSRPGMGRLLKEEATLEGLSLNYKKIERIPNSTEAHRLVQMVPDLPLKHRLATSIYEAYFEQGAPISEQECLEELASKTGIPTLARGRFLDPEQGRLDVQALREAYLDQMVTAVPSLRLGGRFMIHGLQSRETWTQSIRQAVQRLS